ncbi:conserved hypothetical protein [Cupriavidus taiwanensis]|uniref:hypothetical protein n=1 Tax=Cupriavidus taiwanensis TaxID=164546 RepID=UPI000E1AF827|nr:hypothetical protein [Cupriavidus taiwanensis]SPA22843.1 conserved hypothetical protein [Cupriavidus taiwanensis]
MKTKHLFLTGLAAAVLTACGGGGGDSTPTSGPAATKISGTAAVGAALGGATVQAKCASGSGTATTAADGTFTLSIEGATRPCVLSVKTPDGTTLHSVVEAGTGTTAVANITPLTELVTASLAQGSTTAFFDQFDAAAQAKLTSGNLTSATESVRLVLTGVVDLGGVDPLKDPLVAANGANAGNAQDKLLDQLGDRLEASQTTLGELSSAVAANADAAAVQTALQPAAATCAGLKTGKYHVIGLGSAAAEAGDLDAAALKLQVGNETVPFTAVANDNCRFTVPGTNGATNTVMVAKSGIALAVPPAGPMTDLPTLLVPAQAVVLADLAGDWNGLGMERDHSGAPYASRRVTFSIDAAGKLTKGADCSGVNTCEAWLPEELPTLSADADGSFKITDSFGTQLAYAFKGTDGQVTVVITHDDGFMIAAKQVVRPLPVVGTTNSYWDSVLFSGITPTLDGPTALSNEVTSVDTQTGTYTRKRLQDSRLDSWKVNSPAIGLRYRAATSGAPEMITLVPGNTGLSVGISVAGTYYDISVNRP